MEGIQSPPTIDTKQRRIAEIAKRILEPLTSLAHYMDEEWLHEAYRRTRKDGAAGIDKMTAEEYANNLAENLQNLHARLKSGSYRAPAVRRVYIPKDKPGEVRGLGIPTIEDKIVQRAVVMLLEPIYETEFLPCSYGFRPKRGALDAVKDLQQLLFKSTTAVVLELDIRRCFDAIPHGPLQGILRERVNDGTIVRLVGQWLHAGIFENGSVHYSDTGTPQGGVVSPLLMNAYMHTVVDKWFETEVRPRLKGNAHLMRYADDAVLIFESWEDAKRVLEVLPKRFARFGLELHSDKTKLVDFSRPANGRGKGTLTILGFTFFWAKSRRGYPVVKVKTASSRLARAKRRLNDWLKRHRHKPLEWQHATLVRKLEGHYGYYGVSFNFKSLANFLHAAKRLWCKWLGRRSQTGRVSFSRIERILKRYPLPCPRIVTSLF
jgi:group II intron reverse transcriptase/maturase